MDFRHIKAFIAVADTLSVTKAAERLHISQPPLSRHIHQLEEELGLTLFLRHRHGVTLTDDGRRLLEKARALDAAGTEFCEVARQMARGEQSRIRIGIGWGLWDVVNRLRVEFSKQHPNATFEVRDGIGRHSKGKKGSPVGVDASQRAATLEGQIMRIADLIAYVNHDIDDAVRAGMLKDPICRAMPAAIPSRWRHLDRRIGGPCSIHKTHTRVAYDPSAGGSKDSPLQLHLQ